jgi:hypothetical protein
MAAPTVSPFSARSSALLALSSSASLPKPRQRVIRYADREYGAYDEIELEPYARADEAEVT